MHRPWHVVKNFSSAVARSAGRFDRCMFPSGRDATPAHEPLENLCSDANLYTITAIETVWGAASRLAGVQED